MSDPTPVTMDQVETRIAAVLSSISGLPSAQVINEKNPGPRPNDPTLSFLIFHQDGTMWPVRSYVDPPETLTETLRDPTEFGLMLTARGKGAAQRLSKVRLALRSTQRYRAGDLYEIMGLGGCGDVQNTSTSFQGRLMEQASMEVTLHAMLSVSELVDYFTEAPIEIEAQEDEFVFTIPSGGEDDE